MNRLLKFLCLLFAVPGVFLLAIGLAFLGDAGWVALKRIETALQDYAAELKKGSP
jgi:hypothetical protein